MTEVAEIRNQTSEILKSQNKERGKLIPILQEIQTVFGYLPREAMLQVADFLNIPESEIYSVATFYNQFRFVPPGKHQIKVCLGTACQIKSGKVILESWERELDLKEGNTSSDGEFSLERVACVGCCTMAPVTVVDEHIEGKISPIRIKGVLLSFKQDKERTD